jgi:predicted amidophosphoribosyltransferase
MALAQARESLQNGRWTEALEWIAKAPRGEATRRLEAEARYRRAAILVARKLFVEAETEFAQVPRNAGIPAFLLDERQRLIREMRVRKPADHGIIGSTCYRCEVGDWYDVVTCPHQRAPVPRAVKLRIEAFRPAVREVYAAGAYRPGWDREREDPISALVRLEKRRIEPVSMRWIGLLLADYVGGHTPLPGRIDAVVPVPTSREREEQRGGGLPTLLAQAIRDHLAVPLREPIIQVAEHLDHSQAYGAVRKAGLRAAWKHRRDEVLVGRRVLLVDDIVTTGTTLEAAAEMLLEDGVGEVNAVTLLHTELSG